MNRVEAQVSRIFRSPLGKAPFPNPFTLSLCRRPASLVPTFSEKKVRR